jgi:glycosyltransferase involved in cell wall biosynthesis
VAGTVGRMAPVKTHAALVRAVAPLLDEDARLVIAGDGSEAERTRALAVELGVAPWCHLLGAQDDVPAVLAALDVFVLSSHVEGLPLVLLEAMAAGLPVVSTAVGGIPEALNGSGTLVPAGDETALREALANVRANSPAARELGLRGQARVREHHSHARMTDAYLRLYE